MGIYGIALARTILVPLLLLKLVLFYVVLGFARIPVYFTLPWNWGQLLHTQHGYLNINMSKVIFTLNGMGKFLCRGDLQLPLDHIFSRNSNNSRAIHEVSQATNLGNCHLQNSHGHWIMKTHIEVSTWLPTRGTSPCTSHCCKMVFLKLCVLQGQCGCERGGSERVRKLQGNTTRPPVLLAIML